MNKMRIAESPTGFIPAEPKLIIDVPVEDFIAGERIWPGDFLRSDGRFVKRCAMNEATHAALISAGEGEKVQCSKLGTSE